jgi:autotransporter-associated beta strand protein
LTNGALTFTSGAALSANIDLAPGNGPGTATLNLNGGTLTSGRIQVDSGNASGSAAKTIAFNGGTLNLTSTFTLAGNNLTTTVGAGGATIGVQGAAVVTWSPALTPTVPTAGLIKTGSGTLNLAGGGYAAPVTVKAGTLGVAGSVGVAASPIQLGDATAAGGDAATLSINANGTVNSPIIAGTTALAGNYTVNVGADANVSIPNLITMNQPLTISSVATSGSNTLSITGGILSATPTAKNLTFDTAGIIVVASPIAETPGGPVTVVKNGPGILALLAPNTYTGPTQINTGGVLFQANRRCLRAWPRQRLARPANQGCTERPGGPGLPVADRSYYIDEGDCWPAARSASPDAAGVECVSCRVTTVPGISLAGSRKSGRAAERRALTAIAAKPLRCRGRRRGPRRVRCSRAIPRRPT